MTPSFFSAALGGDDGRARWRRAVHAHATWLGHAVVLGSQRVGNDVLEVAFFTAPGRPIMRIAANGCVLDASGLGFRIDDAKERVWVRAPLASPTPLVYTVLRGGCIVLADDLRLVATLTEAQIDDTALASLLAYGCTPPGRTLLHGVREVPAGYELVCGGEERLRCMPSAKIAPAPHGVPTDEDTNRDVFSMLDEALPRSFSHPVVLLSGGVDSALLLGALRARGLHPAAAHYVTVAGGDEVDAARGVARALQVDLDVVHYDPAVISTVFSSLYREYGFPFGDYSATVTNALLRAVARSHPDAVEIVDGTGADALFSVGGAAPRWAHASRLPRGIMSFVASALHWPNQHFRDDNVGRALVVARRLATEPIEIASVLSRHALVGRAFDVAPRMHSEITQTFMAHLDAVSRGCDLADRVMIVDLIHGCARQMAAKSDAPARLRGMRVLWPFLTEVAIARSQRWSHAYRSHNGEPKAILKRALVSQVPRELAYRKKSGFTPDMASIFRGPAVSELVSGALLGSDSPLYARIDRGFLRETMERLHTRQPVNRYVLNFLWAAFFCSSWLNGLDARRRELRAETLPHTIEKAPRYHIG